MKNFEEHIKESLNQFEAKYNPAHWNDLQKRLDKVQVNNPASSIAKKIMYAAGVAASAGLIYYFSHSGSENKQAEKPIVATEQNVSVPDVKENNIPQVKEIQSSEIQNKKSNNNSTKEKNITETKTADNKPASVTKNETSIINNANEKKPVQQQSLPSKAETKPSDAIASFHCDNHTVCLGTSVQFGLDNTFPCTVKWDFGDNQTSSSLSPKHIYKKDGTYTVKVKVISLKDKTSDEKSITDMITVHPVPSVEMNYNLSDENPNDIIFEANANNNSNLKWDFNDNQTSLENNPEHTFNKKGNYPVTVTATNNFGCTATDKRNIHIENDYNLLAPNSFSPNGDGLNDTWIPKALLSGDYTFTLTIFGRNGNEVYKTSDKNQPWDGGGNVKVGDTFVWKAVVKDKNGVSSNYNGIIVIE